MTLKKRLTNGELLLELMENIGELPEHNQRFIKSVNDWFKKKGEITEGQREWLQIFYEQLKGDIES